MYKLALILLIALFNEVIVADANISKDEHQKTYLLTAPGTLSETRKETKKRFLPPPQTNEARPRYRYISDNEIRMRQFGQQQEQSNPWNERPYPYMDTVRPNLQARQPRYDLYNNPWHVDETESPELDLMKSESSYPFVSDFDPLSPELYGGMSNFYSNFADSMYTREGPADMLPSMNRYMPGMGGEGFNFPFMPFGQ